MNAEVGQTEGFNKSNMNFDAPLLENGVHYNQFDGNDLRYLSEQDIIYFCPECNAWHLNNEKITERLEYLRQELRAERISYGELVELESLAAFIDPNDVELREAAGLPEFENEEE